MAQVFEMEVDQHMLKLTQEEQAWLDDYRKAIDGKHPGVVREMLIYGSKARGQAHAESDLDVLLVVTNEAGGLKKKLRRIGYLLAATSNVLPSILAYTQEEWESRRRNRSSFRQAVERDAVRVV
jgi:predicted nucleotidyltransferase